MPVHERQNTPVHSGPDRPLGRVLAYVLREDVNGLLSRVEAALGEDPEGVHQMRVAARRLRGTLRVFRPLFEGLWVRHLLDEVGWLADELGTVRDLDVLQSGLEERPASRLGVRVPVPLELSEAITARCQAARTRLGDVLVSERYLACAERLRFAAQHPALKTRVDRPAGPALLRLVLKRAYQLKRLFRCLRAGSSEELLHEARKRGKDLRYGLSAVTPWLDSEVQVAAKQFARRLGKATDLLGQFQDAVSMFRLLTMLRVGHAGDHPQVRVAIADWQAELFELRKATQAAIVARRKKFLKRKHLSWH